METVEFNKVRLEIDGGLATIVMNDPAALNAAGPSMVEGLNDALTYIEDPAKGIRAAILTGEGRGFCSGANLGGDIGGASKNLGPMDAGAALENAYHPVLLRMKELDMPFISAVNGPAAGVGMSFALMGDMVIADESAYFLQAFRRIGLVPDGGSTYILPRLVGVKRAMELSLMGEKLPAPKALEWGLINRVVPDGTALEEATKLAREMANGPTVSLRNIRKLYWSSLDNSYTEQLHAERVAQREAGRTKDFGEGVQAFLQKRPAEFKGE